MEVDGKISEEKVQPYRNCVKVRYEYTILE